MIRISCTNCKTVLSIDDAFAGGVCRCQHCGTIQTVPSQARGNVKVGASGQAMGGSKSLYQSDTRTGSGSGLDELANVVVSSGLTSNRLKRPAQSADGKPAKQNLMPLIIAGTVLVAVLLVGVIILLSRNTTTSASQPGSSSVNAPSDNTSSNVLPPNTPSFCGTALEGDTIIYLLDSGSATKDYLGALKDATMKSVASLGSDRKFQILFWNNGIDGAYPQNTTTYASKENIAAAEKAIDDVAPFGQSDVKTALGLAVAQHPDVIILATGKGWDLDNAWLDGVMAIRGSLPVKIDTFSLGVNGESAPLKKLASQTGGTYHELSQQDLHNDAQ